MKWIEPTINDIHTTDVIYYSEEKKYICKKVCNILKIDLFPDLNHLEYWRLDRRNGDNWLKCKIADEQCVDVAWGIYDDRIIKQMEKSRNSVSRATLFPT